MQILRYAVYSLLFFLIFRCGLQAQTAPGVSSGADVHAAAANTPLMLSFEYVNRHLYTTLSDEKLGTLTLLVDTGTERTQIAREIAEKGDLHKSFWKTNYAINGYGNKPNEQKYRTVSVALRSGQGSVFSGSALALDFGELRKKIEHPVDGILGWDFFEQWCTTLDFAAKHLILRNLSECAPPAGKHGTLKGEWSAHGLLLPSVLTFPNGRSTNALLHLDTGSDATLILNTQFRATAGLGEGGPAATETTGWGLNGGYGGDIVPISSIDIKGEDENLSIDGRQQITTILIGRPGSFSKVHWWADGVGEAKINRDGAIGNKILEHLIWTFDPAAKQIYVEAAASNNPSKTP
ncbi:MAG: hypothetical protein ABSB30_03220 [Terracidiphilus sp.]|jgi:hypothetical protein